MALYRKKPVVIEAIEWDGSDKCFNEVTKLGKEKRTIRLLNNKRLMIETLEGNHEARIGDFIIQGVKGEIYPCKPDIFAATYEPVKDGDGLLTEQQFNSMAQKAMGMRNPSHIPGSTDKRGARRLG